MAHKKGKSTFHPHPQRVIASKKMQKKKFIIANKRRNDELREHLDRQSNALPIHGISQPQPAPMQIDLSQSLLDVTAILEHL